MEGVKTWLNSQAADSFDTRVQNLFPDTASALILAVTTLRSNLSMYVFLYIINSFLTSCVVNSSPGVTFRIALVLVMLFAC
jgi:hypothetical protein